MNTLPESEYNRLKNKPQLHPATETLKAYNHSQILVKGKRIVNVHHEARKHKLMFFVVLGDKQTPLGRQACNRLGLVRVAAVVTNDNYEELLTEYSDIFKGFGCLYNHH